MEKKREKLTKEIKVEINIKKLKKISKKYKKNSIWKYKSKIYPIDFCKMYQKLLFNMAGELFDQKKYKKASYILITSFLMAPKNYLNYFLERFLLKKTNNLKLENILKDL